MKKTPEEARIPLAGVEGRFLYYDDVANAIPADISSADSIETARNIIRKWATDILMYENAKRNTPNEAEIEKMVQEYRKSLIIHQYQQNLIDQRLKIEPEETQIESFYKQYGAQMLLKEPVIKGFLLIAPNNSPKLEEMREWVRKGNTASLENIEKYWLQNAISYDYFADNWAPVSSVLKKLPIQTKETIEQGLKNSFYETADTAQRYLLHINDYIPAGQPEPYELAKDKITNILRMRIKADYISSFENDLYNEAVKTGAVMFYEKNEQ
ncbi:MAG: hypothetical protein LBS07_00390 [Prevotellaceae bacterium]|jgi:hypothetical protein|nr:hypothetical protein [Prevotellaceae bacterium]